MIGSIYDMEFDEITVDLECLGCPEEASADSFMYDEEKKVVMVAPETPTGVYQIQLKISDDNEDDPKSTLVSFRVVIKQETVYIPQDVFDPTGGSSDDSSDVDKTKGKISFKITEVSSTGLVHVSFSEGLRRVSDLSQISKDTLKLELIPDETNQFDDVSQIGFDWSATEFEPNFMSIQIEWNNPYQVSAGLQRDSLTMTVLDSNFFFSARSFASIPANASQTAKVPKMMPKTAFSEVFTQITKSATSATNIAMASNFFINILLSGAMGFLWGLLHCMQIISHFALVNINMPGNAHFLFQILVQIATLNILPT